MVAKKSVVFKNAIIDTIEGVTINISTSDELLGDPA
jgi:hypothetical protein|nr:MAG TPA: hypothetical protein [Caudoviricetes sp.]